MMLLLADTRDASDLGKQMLRNACVSWRKHQHLVKLSYTTRNTNATEFLYRGVDALDLEDKHSVIHKYCEIDDNPNQFYTLNTFLCYAPQENDSQRQFLRTLCMAIHDHGVDYLCGDFNMSTFRIAPILRENNIPATCLAWYAWKLKSTPTVVGNIHFDSMAVFATKTIIGISRSLNYSDYENPDENLDEWNKGQGFVLSSYLGGQRALRQTLDNIHVCGDGELPHSKQVLVNTKMWDGSSRVRGVEKTAGLFWESDGHMPLLVYMGKLPHRSDTAMTRRETRSIARGWGPGSDNRRRDQEARAKAKGKPSTHDHGGTGKGARPTTHGHGASAQAWAPQGGSSSSSTWWQGAD